MEIDPNGSLQEMIESCTSASRSFAKQWAVIRADDIADQSGGMGGMMQDLAFAIPGVDEAMGFAEIMKYVHPLDLFPPVYGATTRAES